MTKEQAIKKIQAIIDCDLRELNTMPQHKALQNEVEALDMASKALEQQPSDDCVSRQAVVEYIKASGAELGHDCENEAVIEDILALPPVTPTFPKGATNGDMIKAMFPNVNFGTLAQDDVIVNKDYSNNGEPQVFIPIRVWNAPYKRGDLDGSN